MNEIEIFKEQVYKQGLNTLLKRMEVILPCYELKALTNPVIVSATIVDMDAVICKIKETWTIFNIKDVKVDLKSQIVNFKVYGKCYIPEKYRTYILMTWAETQTEECNYLEEIEEKYAQEHSLPLTKFINNGIVIEMV